MVEKSLSCERRCILHFLITEILIYMMSGSQLFFLGQCPTGGVSSSAASHISSSHPVRPLGIQLSPDKSRLRKAGVGRSAGACVVHLLSFSADTDLDRNMSPHPNVMDRFCSEGHVTGIIGTEIGEDKCRWAIQEIFNGNGLHLKKPNCF